MKVNVICEVVEVILRECNEAKRPMYGSEGVDWGVARGSQGVKRTSRGYHGAIGLV